VLLTHWKAVEALALALVKDRRIESALEQIVGIGSAS
jgi:hypothetical protein